jgi:hypothetical protein
VFSTLLAQLIKPSNFLRLLADVLGGMVDCLLVRAKLFLQFYSATWESAMTEWYASHRQFPLKASILVIYLTRGDVSETCEIPGDKMSLTCQLLKQLPSGPIGQAESILWQLQSDLLPLTFNELLTEKAA